MGAPTKYTKEMGEEICARMANGETLHNICKSLDISRLTVYRWATQQTHPFFNMYARARDMQADTMADEIIDIADDPQYDWAERTVGRGIVVLADHEHIHRSQLRVDARKWIASKLKPKKYGERITQEIETRETKTIEVVISHGDTGGVIEGELTVPRLDGPTTPDSGESGSF